MLRLTTAGDDRGWVWWEMLKAWLVGRGRFLNDKGCAVFARVGREQEIAAFSLSLLLPDHKPALLMALRVTSV